MLRITFEEHPSGPTIRLEGRLVGPWVQELKAYWQSIRGSKERDTIRVVLNAVTSIDENGKVVLQQVHQNGGLLIASGCQTKAIVEEVTARPSENSKPKSMASPSK
ncbi:hypothetical protein [Candidatus Nitronereus thalassa]|uniref:Uncharacterized protein n=1 Tax=Candidatus Nitronereus thalassa TaxID=3020898 RepID=A0ABU3K774_9BACT|nr:hypothetical protein [Candidatus Nitronereus thalassa]MDT7042208.1 hypothetical protein [Candidatus Nitronereus thalassa]